MSEETQKRFISVVRPGDQAIVLTLLAQNENGVELLDSQLELALNMAKNVIQMTGASVNAAGSIVTFPTWPDNESARLEIVTTLKTTVDSEAISDDTASTEV